MASKKGKRRRRSTAKRPGTAAAPPAAETSGAPNRLGVVVAVAGLAALFVAVLLAGRQPSAPPAAEAPAAEAGESRSALELWRAAPAREIALGDASFTRGPADAPITLVEFSDFECPFCREASRSVAELERAYEGRLRVVFRDFPLDTSCNEYLSQQMHPLACRAARLARCAGAQGAFWAAHDALFELDALSEAALEELPVRLGLDESSLASCMASEETAARIRADIDTGRELDVTGTPALFVNDRPVASFGVDDLRSILDHILSSS